MRLGIDYLLATTHAPGLGRYTRELVRALCQLDGDHSLRLWQWGAMARKFSGESLGLGDTPERSRDIRLPGRLQGPLSRMGFSPQRLIGPLDLFHRILPGRPAIGSLPFTLPLVEIPPAGSPAHQALGAELRRAAGVFVFCRNFADRAQSEFSVRPERVFQVPVGSDHWVRDLGAQVVPRKRRVLVLGAMGSARRSDTVLRAMEHYWRRGGGLDLLWVGHGAGSGLAASRAQSEFGDRMEHRLPEESEMPRLVAESQALIHLSQDEGSPVTPLEAMAMGLHPILEKLPAFEEALGPRVPPSQWLKRDPEPEALARALSQVEKLEPGDRQPLAQHTWRECAQAHLQAWNTLLALEPGPELCGKRTWDPGDPEAIP